MMNSSGRGRRAGNPDTRTQILDVARRRFLQGGYQAVTLRSVASEAGVDVALISYYFGSKKGLFGAALTLSANPAETLARTAEGDPATFPQRALRDLLALWEDPESGAPLRALIVSATRDQAIAGLVKEMLEREMIDKIAARLGGADARRRAGAFCAQIAGLIVTRCILRLEPVASMAPDEIIRIYGPPLRLALRESSRHQPRTT
ncbi:TetR family transcriptional regulator [Streptomyces cupreus]|uniref:TetR/AcrR family transcriptional regulator n=1 Tax=Streptomyces cupreus TaxID=2759956 RepID=A0A7X1MDX9_9ACTN|nr:TetR family transcriptional regulator [Streptomyces cupreus]MBC2907416.1 TetR/AcrR family transcriptional regulator [Streptomyces cupreus]